MNAHAMTIISTSGKTECWICPDCGRTLLVTWKPWSKIVICDGDPTVAHTGGKGVVMDVEINNE